MSNDKLVILENKLPLKAYPENDLDIVLKTVFKFWLSSLLSMKADNEDKIDLTLPVIKKQCWSMGINQVKEMFEMYADGKLMYQEGNNTYLRPISNYFDRTLVGQIHNRFILEKRKNHKKVLTKTEKENQDYVNVIGWFDWFIQNRKVTKEMTWIYDYLILKDKYFVPKEKFRLNLVQKGIDEGMDITDAKAKMHRTLIRMHFERLEDKGMHIKSMI